MQLSGTWRKDAAVKKSLCCLLTDLSPVCSINKSKKKKKETPVEHSPASPFNQNLNQAVAAVFYRLCGEFPRHGFSEQTKITVSFSRLGWCTD